jgi:hypothetical protein
MNRFRAAIGVGVLLYALCAIATSASAAEFKAKEKCPNGNVGCFGNAKPVGNQVFSFTTEGGVAFKITCTIIELAKNGLYAVPQEVTKEIQVNGPQKLEKGEEGKEIGLKQEEKARWAVIKPVYTGCKFITEGVKEKEATISFSEANACTYVLDAGVELIKPSVSILPKKCKVIIRVPGLGGCEMELRGSENIEQKEAKFKEKEGKVVAELALTKLKGETNENCAIGPKGKFEGTYTGTFEIEKAEVK